MCAAVASAVAAIEWEDASMSTADQDLCAFELKEAASTNTSPPNSNLSLVLFQPTHQLIATSTVLVLDTFADFPVPTESLPEKFDIDSFHSSEDGASDIRNFLGLLDMPHSSSYEEIVDSMYTAMEPALEERWYYDAEDTETVDSVADDSALGTSSVLSSIAEEIESLPETFDIDSLFHASSAMAPDLEEWWYSDAEDSLTDGSVAGRG